MFEQNEHGYKKVETMLFPMISNPYYNLEIHLINESSDGN